MTTAQELRIKRLEQRVETLETAIKAVLRYISSHQVYDKDARGILSQALAQRDAQEAQ